MDGEPELPPHEAGMDDAQEEEVLDEDKLVAELSALLREPEALPGVRVAAG